MINYKMEKKRTDRKNRKRQLKAKKNSLKGGKTEKKKRMLLVVSEQAFFQPPCLVTVEKEAVIGPSLVCADATCTSHTLAHCLLFVR